jgi:hypothetical protein
MITFTSPPNGVNADQLQVELAAAGYTDISFSVSGAVFTVYFGTVKSGDTKFQAILAAHDPSVLTAQQQTDQTDLMNAQNALTVLRGYMTTGWANLTATQKADALKLLVVLLLHQFRDGLSQ